MAEEKQDEVKFEMPTNAGRILIEPLNHAMAAGVRQAMSQGVRPEVVIEMFMNHTASVIAMIEPVEVRESTLKAVVAQFASLTQQHVDRRNMTPGGIIVARNVQ